MVTSESQESDFGTSVRTSQSQKMGEEAARGIGAAVGWSHQTQGCGGGMEWLG